MREKHQSEIINYGRRSQAGKTIGSGRVVRGSRFNRWFATEERSRDLESLG